jgi:tetratricopeptide (TPR) repeat protein
MQAQELIKQLDEAFVKRAAGDYSGALQEFESLERRSWHPQDIAALRFFRATCLTDLGRAEDALKRISEVDKNQLIFSKQIDYEYERARIERALGHTREALDLVRIALKMVDAASDKAEVSVVSRGLETLRGILLAESGRCEEALPVLEAVPTDDDGWAEARIRLGDCKIRKKLYREALEHYLSVTSSSKELDPIHRKTALRNVGCAYYYMGNYRKAIEYLTKVEHGYDGHPDLKAELCGVLASAYSRLGMTQEAAKYGGFSKGTNAVQ